MGRTEEEFLALIREQPEEDTLRLVFADWLQEQDQESRAEFIRLQIKIARNRGRRDYEALLDKRQAFELFAKHYKQWLAHDLRHIPDALNVFREMYICRRDAFFDGDEEEKRIASIMSTYQRGLTLLAECRNTHEMERLLCVNHVVFLNEDAHLTQWLAAINEVKEIYPVVLDDGTRHYVAGHEDEGVEGDLEPIPDLFEIPQLYENPYRHLSTAAFEAATPMPLPQEEALIAAANTMDEIFVSFKNLQDQLAVFLRDAITKQPPKELAKTLDTAGRLKFDFNAAVPSKTGNGPNDAETFLMYLALKQPDVECGKVMMQYGADPEFTVRGETLADIAHRFDRRAEKFLLKMENEKRAQISQPTRAVHPADVIRPRPHRRRDSGE